ncbi:hypothetical protein ACNOYE_10990 [Nannocystaceae bacterium ST9]
MRLIMPTFALALPLVIPAVAEASPFAIRLSTDDLARLTLDEAPGETSAPAIDPAAAPAEGEAAPDAGSEVAPDEAPVDPDAPPSDEPADDDILGDPADDPAAEDEYLEEELAGPQKKGDFNRHAIGVNGGIHLAPSYFLSSALASYANSMCRKEVGKWGEDHGLVKVAGCNAYVNGGYTVRIHRGFDIQANVGYLHIKLPDAAWLDNSEWDRDSCEVNDNSPGSKCNLGAADYTQVDLRMVTIEVNFVGRGTLYRNQDVEVQLGGGGGIGAGILVGKGIFQTPLGTEPGSRDNASSCQTLADLADFRKCTPRYYDDDKADQDGDGNDMDISREEVDMGGALPSGKATGSNDSWVKCTRDQCDVSDLDAIGRKAPKGQPWAAYPVINLFASFRIIVKDTFGITIDGGIKDGFFFGGGMQYYFGGGGKDRPKDKSKTKNTTAPVEPDLDAESAAGTE